MTDGPALLATILSQPDDDTPRLVYADWLEEDDQPERAEFIRAQCRVAVITRSLRDAGSPADLSDECGIEGCECAARTALRRRADELLSIHGGRWLGLGAADWVSSSPGVITRPNGWRNETYTFARGFASAVSHSWEWWAEHADALLAREPVRAVTLTTMPEIEFRGSEAGRTRDVCRLSGRTWRPIPHGDGERSRTKVLCEWEWPGVTFTIPLIDATWTMNQDATPLADIAVLRERLMREVIAGAAIPPAVFDPR